MFNASPKSKSLGVYHQQIVRVCAVIFYYFNPFKTFSQIWCQRCLSTMSCRDIHATTAFSFIIAFVSVVGLVIATVIPQWRTTRLLTFNLHAKNITVYDGLWTKCVRRDGSPGCYYFDAEWYSKVDQLDVRILQFCLPAGLSWFATLMSFLYFNCFSKAYVPKKRSRGVYTWCQQTSLHHNINHNVYFCNVPMLNLQNSYHDYHYWHIWSLKWPIKIDCCCHHIAKIK